MKSEGRQSTKDHYIASIRRRRSNTGRGAYERTYTESQSAVQRVALIYSLRGLAKGWFVSLYAPMSSRHQIGAAKLLGG